MDFVFLMNYVALERAEWQNRIPIDHGLPKWLGRMWPYFVWLGYFFCNLWFDRMVQCHSCKATVGRKAWLLPCGWVPSWRKVGLIVYLHEIIMSKEPGNISITSFVEFLCLFCSFIDIEQIVGSEAYSDLSSPSHPSSHTSDGSGPLFTSSSESSYNSDQGSGNEDGREASYIIYEESSDEVDFLVGWKKLPSNQLNWNFKVDFVLTLSVCVGVINALVCSVFFFFPWLLYY